MNITVHEVHGIQVAEMQSEGIIMRSTRDAADIIAQLLKRGLKKLILHERNMSPEFWQEPSELAGEMLKKFTDNSIAVAFVGEFTRNRSRSLRAFIHERDLEKQVFFSDKVDVAEMSLSK